ncbi:MAG: DUF1998 domain-containing protein [Alphaproteobacteria bacterium]|nr:DUF1998 domain-containing protein [Alphaproteobacteria bacterium]
MIATGILHEATWHWNVLAWFLGYLILAMTLVAVLLVTAAMRPRQGPLLERSLFAFGPAAAAPPLLFLILRLFERVETAFGPGPQYWLLGWIPNMAGRWVHPYDTIVAVHVITAGVAGAIAILAAIILPPSQHPANQAPLPGRWGAATVLILGALLIPFFAFRVYVDDIDSARLLEWVAAMPTLALCLSLRVHARLQPPPDRAARQAPDEVPLPVPDFRKAWISAGLLDAEAKPLARVQAEARGQAPSSRAASAWTAAGAPGAAPRALDQLLEDLPGAHDLFVVGDLPEETENALLTALLADLVGARGLRVLVVHPEPQRIAGDLDRAMRTARTWDPGAVVCGPDALYESMVGQQVPALTLVSQADVGRRLIKMAVSDAHAWVLGIDLIVVHRPDLGTPIEVTHTAFVWRRWHLATGRLAAPPVLAISPDTPAHRAFLEQLFPGRESIRVGYAPRVVGETLAWPGRDPEPDSARPWLGRATEVVTRLGYPATAFDPSGRWGRDVLPAEVGLRRMAAWLHDASAGDLEPSSLVESTATLPNRLPVPKLHQSLWLLPTDPVARFLHPGRLAKLTETGRLPRPAPVVGMRNRFLRLAHLDAALREAPNDELTLRSAFGDDLVDFRLRTATDPITRSQNHSAWRRGGEILRSPQLQAPASAGSEPGANTVTNDVVEIVEGRSGEVLLKVDARTASTRFYPKRVFGLGTRRYRVPMHAFDAKRRKLTVDLASPRDRVTHPVLSFGLDIRSTTVERVTRRHGRFTMHTLSADVLVTERVHSAWVPASDQEERFDAVESQYDTEARFIFPDKGEKGLGLFHLAATVESLLPVFLRCEAADVAVTPVRAGFLEGMGAGVAVVDRFVGGMGFANALDDGALAELLTWARAMLYECGCMDGCEKCSPAAVLRVGPDKQAVLKMLDGL